MEYDDLVKEERKISMEELREFGYEIKKIYDSKMAQARLKIEELEQLNRQLSNMIEGQKDFIKNHLSKQERRLREVERLTGMDLR
jgi:hypothetical protein